MGHEVRSVDGADMGGFQAIMCNRKRWVGQAVKARVYRGGSDHHKDGAAVGW
jgi:gamma-glutamyltranspeptidase